jgi:hypothetical protein
MVTWTFRRCFRQLWGFSELSRRNRIRPWWTARVNWRPSPAEVVFGLPPLSRPGNAVRKTATRTRFGRVVTISWASRSRLTAGVPDPSVFQFFKQVTSLRTSQSRTKNRLYTVRTPVLRCRYGHHCRFIFQHFRHLQVATSNLNKKKQTFFCSKHTFSAPCSPSSLLSALYLPITIEVIEPTLIQPSAAVEIKSQGDDWWVSVRHTSDTRRDGRFRFGFGSFGFGG